MIGLLWNVCLKADKLLPPINDQVARLVAFIIVMLISLFYVILEVEPTYMYSCEEQEPPLTPTGQRGRCSNIKGEPQIYGLSLIHI